MTARLRELETLLRDAIDDVVEKRIAKQVAVARAAQRILALVDGERPTERIARENTKGLELMAAYRGKPRDAAKHAARQIVEDPHAQGMLAQRLRSLRRRQQK